LNDGVLGVDFSEILLQKVRYLACRLRFRAFNDSPGLYGLRGLRVASQTPLEAWLVVSMFWVQLMKSMPSVENR